MLTKKCHVEILPEPPPPDPCSLQRKRQKEKAGVIFCPKPPVVHPDPPPDCLAVCIEKIKNPVVPPTPKFPIVCVVERKKTGTARCDEIFDLAAAHPDYFWPNCPPRPVPPPEPPINPCEIQKKREKKEQCQERMKRYLL